MFQHLITLALLFTLAIIFPGGPASAQPGIDSPQVDSIIMKAMDLVYVDRNSEGVEEFKKLIDLFPDNPIGYFYVSASLQTVMTIIGITRTRTSYSGTWIWPSRRGKG